MSFFGVTLRTIEKVWNHPNADKLDISQVSGTTFQFIVGRNEYKVGDRVLYFPVDSLLPQPLIDKLGLTGRLSGKEKNRIKTVRLRGSLSQGIVARPETIFGKDPLNNFDPNNPSLKSVLDYMELSPEDLTLSLGVTKYEPPIVPCKAGNLVHLPEGISVYDIEGADNYPDIVAILMDINKRVSISEKLEGMNYWCSLSFGQDKYISSILVGQRHHQIEPIEGAEHDFWKATKAQKLNELVHLLANHYYGKRVTLRGEYVGPGVQNNIYKLQENKVYIFDILVDGKYLGQEEFIKWTKDILTPPNIAQDVILKDWLAGRTIREASNGLSALSPEILREGIVIKPMAEEEVPVFGRLFLKQRSPEYLAGSDF